MDRAPGLSARLKLTLSYAAFLMLAGALLLAAVWVFLLRYVPEQALIVHSKVTEALRVLRQRNSWKGFRDEWKKELGDD